MSSRCFQKAKFCLGRALRKKPKKTQHQEQQDIAAAGAIMNTAMARPELGGSLEFVFANLSISTAEIAANAPRYRRKSSTFIDAIHDVPEDKSLAPAQLYSTMSGRLFHSGRIAIVMVGLPARGKT